MKIFFRVLKYTLYLTPALIVLIVAVRLVLSGDPPESRLIINTQSLESAYRNLGDDFIMYEINVRNPFALGDTFYTADILYLESSGDLQLSFRGKKNKLEELRSHLNVSEGNYADLLSLYIRAETRIPADADDKIGEETVLTEIFEVSARYLFETGRYEYIRVNFSGIEIDYRRTKLELFAFGQADVYELGDWDIADYLARLTLLDINMPREKVKIGKFEILNKTN
ncbi:MAG: hypothetical protein FWH24_01040 [Oscillospiraceae bacterium]|nr:hypothetical protein [Oscillospiraceae bacterium]